MNAADLMTEYPDMVTPDDPLSHAAGLMRDSDVGFIPVVADRESKRLVGVITDRDITIRHVANAHVNECRVGQHMTDTELVTVRVDASADEVHDLMAQRQLRRVPVTDADGRILGVIALADVAVKEERPDAAGRVIAGVSKPARPDR